MAEQGIAVGHGRVRRLMRAGGIDARAGKRKRSWPKPKPAFDAPNLLARCFTAAKPNQAWVADATEFETGEGTFYMAVVLDLFARRIVGWSTSSSMHRSLMLSALGSAFSTRDGLAGLLHHSDCARIRALVASTRVWSTRHYSARAV